MSVPPRISPLRSCRGAGDDVSGRGGRGAGGGGEPEAVVRLGLVGHGQRAGSASLCSTAHSAAWVRDASPSLPRMFET